MRIIKQVALPFLCTLSHVVVIVLLVASFVQAQHPILLGIRGGVEVWSVPQPPPLDGFGATKIFLRATDPEATIVVFENLVIDGELVQQFVPQRFGQAIPTPFMDTEMPNDWRAVDSHLNVRFGENAAGNTVTEMNDMSDPNGISSQLSLLNDGATAVSGLGPILIYPVDPRAPQSIILEPAFQTNDLDFAYLVVPCDVVKGDNDVSLTLGVLGDGVVDAGSPGGAQWGYGENPNPLKLFPPTGNVPCIPEPGPVSLLGLGALMSLGLSRRFKTKLGKAERFHSNPVMRVDNRFALSLSSIALFYVCSLMNTATAQDVEIVAAELGGVSVVSIPQPSPLPGLLATKVVLRTAPENRLVTFENARISGAVHQVWIPNPMGPPTPTPRCGVPGWHLLPPEWIAADSHFSFSSMIGGGAGGCGGGGGFGGPDEVNDLSNPVGANESLPLLNGVAQAVTGIGETTWLFPDIFDANIFNTNEEEFAYVVTPDESTGAAGNVFLTVGVLGEGIINSGEPGGAHFGFFGNDPVVIPFIPEPSTAALAMFGLVAVTWLRRQTK